MGFSLVDNVQAAISCLLLNSAVCYRPHLSQLDQGTTGKITSFSHGWEYCHVKKAEGIWEKYCWVHVDEHSRLTNLATGWLLHSVFCISYRRAFYDMCV